MSRIADTPPPPTKKTTRSKAEALRKQVLKIVQSQSRDDYALGEMIYLVCDTALDGRVLYQVWGFNTLQEYANKELQIGITTATNLRMIYEVFGITLAGHWSKQDLLSRSKMYELAKWVKAHNVSDWLKKAKTMSVDELRSISRKRSPRKQRGSRVFEVVVNYEEEDTILKGMALARKTWKTKRRRGERLALIIEEWMAYRRKVRSP